MRAHARSTKLLFPLPYRDIGAYVSIDLENVNVHLKPSSFDRDVIRIRWGVFAYGFKSLFSSTNPYTVVVRESWLTT